MDIKLKIYDMLDDAGINVSYADLVLARLDGLGFCAESHHVFTIGFAIMKSYISLKSSCNFITIPQELVMTLVDFSVADVLSCVNASGYLHTYFSDDTPIKSVDIGDTSVSFDYSCSSSIDNFIDALNSNCREAIVCFRRLRW